MNPFDQRWQQATLHARNAQPQTDDTAPFGFATRVIAHWPAPETTALLWQTLALRMLGAMTSLLLVLVVLGTLIGDDRPTLQIGLEDTVGDLFWIQ